MVSVGKKVLITRSGCGTNCQAIGAVGELLRMDGNLSFVEVDFACPNQTSRHVCIFYTWKLEPTSILDD